MLDTRIAAVQMNCPVGKPSANIAAIARFLRQAKAKDVDIVCFPELGVSGYNTADAAGRSISGGPLPEPEPVPGPSSEKLAKLGRDMKIWFLAGILERDPSGIVFNTQCVFGPSGLIGKYRKTHVPTAEVGTFCHGADLPVFSHPKVRFGVEICYDSHFPEVSTALAGRGAELLFLPHASGGASRKGGEGEPAGEKKARWLRYMPARAYDNTVFVAVCNQSGENGAGRDFAGVSFMCDPQGRVIAESRDGGRDEMVVADLAAADLSESRRVPDSFFRHFRRPELYDRWSRERA